MESAILKVFIQDQEAQEKLKTLNDLSEKSSKRIEKKRNQAKENIWKNAHLYVETQKELLQKDFEESEAMNEKQSQELLKLLEEKFNSNKKAWEEELIRKVTELEEESESL